LRDEAGGRSPVTAHADAFDGSRVLVTGATGLVGCSLVRLLSDFPCRLRLLARRAPEALQPGAADTEVVTGDVRDARVLERALDAVDIVFHLAAQTSAAVAERDPHLDWEVNVWPVLLMLERFRCDGRRPTVILAGTATQAGVPTTLALDESAVDRPLTVYDTHKLMSEQYLELYARLGLVRGTSLRLPTVYGPGPPARGSGRGLVGGCIRRALAGEPLTIYGTGSYLRDFLHVSDAAGAFVAAAARVDAVSGRHFVLGTGTGRTVAEAIRLVAESVRAETGSEVPVKTVDPPRGWSALDERDVVVDSSAFAAATGWSPTVPFEDGIRSTVAALVPSMPGRVGTA
jgi:nucleoside-diphosphate-sugar epimerase